MYSAAIWRLPLQPNDFKLKAINGSNSRTIQTKSVVSPSAIVVTAVISSFWIIVLKMLVHKQMGSMMLLDSLLVSEIHSQNSYKT
jgi:hypothetical protein